MIRRVIVTGGTGVTGNALLNVLLEKNIKVTALIHPGSYRKHYLPKGNFNLTVIESGMEEYPFLGKLLKEEEYDAFFHLAWSGSTGNQKVQNRNDYKLQNLNVAYAINAVELCHDIHCPVFVMTGSQAEYGRKDRPFVETDEKKPENGYGMAKLCAEGMTRLLCREYGIKHIWPVLFSVYGPCDATESMIDVTIRKLLRGEKLPYTPAEQKWDYLFSYDAANALLLLAENGEDGQVYHVAGGKTEPLSYYIKTIYRLLAPGENPRIGELPYNNKQVMFLGADISKLKQTTGFVPQYTFEEGINKIWKSIKDENIGGAL